MKSAVTRQTYQETLHKESKYIRVGSLRIITVHVVKAIATFYTFPLQWKFLTRRSLTYRSILEITFQSCNIASCFISISEKKKQLTDQNTPCNSRRNTVVTPIDAAAFISFFAIQLRRLFEGGVYSGAAFIQKSLYSELNIVLHMVTFLLGNSNKSQCINVVHFDYSYSIVIFTQS